MTSFCHPEIYHFLSHDAMTLITRWRSTTWGRYCHRCCYTFVSFSRMTQWLGFTSWRCFQYWLLNVCLVLPNDTLHDFTPPRCFHRWLLNVPSFYRMTRWRGFTSWRVAMCNVTRLSVLSNDGVTWLTSRRCCHMWCYAFASFSRMSQWRASSSWRCCHVR